MPKFLAAARLSAAIGLLSDTRAKAALLDFLIVKRTLVIKGAAQVAIVQAEAAYVQATRELAAVNNKDRIEIAASSEIFNVFASGDSKSGFRSGKYISNGTGSTIANNTWQTIIELSADKPRRASFRTDYVPHLADLLLKDSSIDKPSLAEVAVWNYTNSGIRVAISIS
jgi:hypothetical protein